MTGFQAGDVLARCLVFSRFFEGDSHTDATLWAFGATKSDGAAHESAYLIRLIEPDTTVHDLGCALAANQNEANGYHREHQKRRYYCGYRTADVENLSLHTDDYSVRLTISPESGINAHVDVALTLSGTSKNERATHRSDAGMALASFFGAPVTHRCTCDNDDTNHPFDRFGADCLSRKLDISEASHSLSSTGLIVHSVT